MADLRVDFAGIRLENPLIASAGPITSNFERVKKLADAGVGAAITKTGFTKQEYEKWVGRKGIFPYKPGYKYMSLQNGTLLCLATLSDVSVLDMAKRIEKMKNELDIPIIGSIMGLSIEGYRESARILESAGADAIEIDLCCPIPEFITLYKYAGQNASLNPKIYAKIVKSVKKTVSIPVGVKSTVSSYIAPKILEGLLRTKISNKMPDFITLVGQLDQNPGIDIDTLKPLVPHFPTMGWEGELDKLTFSALAMFSTTLGINNPVLSASGGIRDFKGVINSLALGATTVQFQTLVLDKGPNIIKKINKNLHSYLDAHGFSSINEIIGSGIQDYIPSLVLGEFMRERDRLYGILYAAVNHKLCNGCGICENICTENAIIIKDKKAIIEKEKCRGCNLCVLKCPKDAIRLENFEELEKLIEKYRNSERAQSFKVFMNKRKFGIIDMLTLYRKLKRWELY